MLKNTIIILVLVNSFLSCNFFKSTDNRQPIARVNNAYLYSEDIIDLVAEGTSASDSIQLVNAYINRWATQLLLVEGAHRNLPKKKQETFKELVVQYENDLLTRAYLEALVKKSIDTIVANAEAKTVFEANKEAFKLNEELIQLRYIIISESTINKKSIVKRFKRFDSKDKYFLDSISIQFKSSFLNDSLWIKKSRILEELPIFKEQNKKELLKRSNFLQLKDSLGVYLVQIKDVLLPGHNAPLEYVRPSVNQIIINKRKLELIQELENDITKDAINNNQFETFN